MCDLPKGSSEGKGRAEGCDRPWGGGEDRQGWTWALLGWRHLGLGLRWGMVLDRMVALVVLIHPALDQPSQQGPKSPGRPKVFPRPAPHTGPANVSLF